MRVTATKLHARAVIGMAGAAATSIALTLALAGTPANAATIPQAASPVVAAHAPKLTAAELKSLHKLLSTKRGREEFYTTFENSFGHVAGIGTSTVPEQATGKLGLRRFNLTYGLSGSGGEHFWIIASYADILSKALDRATPYCVAGLSLFIDPVAAAAVCGGIVYAIDRLAAGHSPLGNHGVWAEVHFRPFWTGEYTW